MLILIVSAAALRVMSLAGDINVDNEEGIRTAALNADMVRVRSTSMYVVELLVVLTLTHGVCFPHALLNGVVFLSDAMLDTNQ